MNQGGNTETVAPALPSSLENQHFGDINQSASTSTYLSLTSAPEAISWATHKVNGSSNENGPLPNSTFQYNQPAVPPARNVQDGLNVSSVACSSSSFVTSNSTQDYNAYAPYSNSADPYGCANAGYQGYYNNYQQQPNHSYSQPVGAYQNTGAPYQPLSSFQNTEFYAGSTSYSTTYYNPGDYQTAGGYQTSSFSNQTTSWSGGSYGNYVPNQYAQYTPDSSGAYSSSSTNANSLQYQQHYKQWANYYSQTEVSCAPGTEKLPTPGTANVGYLVHGSTSYPAPHSQPTPSYTPSWRPESGSTELVSAQHGAVNSGNHDGYWKHGAPNSQVHLTNASQPHFEKPLDLKTSYDSFQDQQKPPGPQGPNLHSQAHLSPQSYQVPSQSIPPLEARKTKLQIPTNPRIASNLSILKASKDSSTVDAALQPSYISVSMLKPNEKELSNDTTESVLKPGMFPKSLRGYVERALARCKDEKLMTSCQSVLKEMITKATVDGTLYTKDWDMEPLFPLPSADAVNTDNLQGSNPLCLLSKIKRSPSRRSKSRWEPLPVEKPANATPPYSNGTAAKYDGWANVSERDKKTLSGTEGKYVGNSRFPLWDQRTVSKISQGPAKKQRVHDGSAPDNDGAYSDSDKEQSLTAYYSGAMALANLPEEKKKRENRSKRFEKGHGRRGENNNFKPKSAGIENLYTRRASALVAKNLENGGSRAVEDMDWDALTIKGTCQEIEKRYLRLTSAPDPNSVRPEEVLEKALNMVQMSQKNYLYKCDQLKSIRQDLTVQRIRNQLTAKVYETHARLALEFGDLPEYNQCQSQLKTLYADGIEGCHMEFAAYNLLCAILHSNNKKDLLSLMSRLSDQAKKDVSVNHALAVRAAVTSGNYVKFFRLHKAAPNLNACLMDLYAEKMRYKAVNCMSRSYRPSLPVPYIAQVLGFSTSSGNEVRDREVDVLEECTEWLKGHGACLITDSNGEMQLDTKASSTTLYMPEPEDAVAHGDANLDVNDFFTRTPS
ncbi:SAC3 family protein A-like isoform X1 [Cucurbita moschata]|uniref:SAC3 family protein A-like isoform X1 n=1 Tax=Cucurbita moschata TaxID=3662 RepID=A0A6J1FWF1_CUCMO|nr:SAC3 family protein A-like isoform X1 [Cucurbita moschata]XP_022942500.1 SAC3 family protein A-like isoform X1 [Cucurbita moschata]